MPHPSQMASVPMVQLMDAIRTSLQTGAPIQNHFQQINDLQSHDPFFSQPKLGQIYLTLFQANLRPLRWGSQLGDIHTTLDHLIDKLRHFKHFKQFQIENPKTVRILLEIVTSETPVDINLVYLTHDFSERRFEPGITGIKARFQHKTTYYMPTDAVTLSHLDLEQALNHLALKMGIAKKDQPIEERIQHMLELPIEYSILKSQAFITFQDQVLPLYRGLPAPFLATKEMLQKKTSMAIDWLVKNMRPDGRFLYYYDPIRDSELDHSHSDDPNYYNILRHSGGILLLLSHYQNTKESRYLLAAQKAIVFLVKQIHKPKEFDSEENTKTHKPVCFVFFNQKAKLGGSGLALAALARLHQLSGEHRYDSQMACLAQHILTQIDPDGEMIGYYLHPKYNGGAPLIHPTKEEKKALFSFYYPGEALLGMALYAQLKDIDPTLQKEIHHGARRALHFLIHLRPQRYPELFPTLPADGWLMQAIETWWEEPQFRENSWLDFVFADAQKMVDHMYTPGETPYEEYPGSFYYQFGDQGYPDAARAEGLIAAYYLAKKAHRPQLAAQFLKASEQVMRSLLPLFITEESAYAHRNPQKSVGAIRFKLTRQWIRVDSVQHAASFLLRFLPVYGSPK
ncbi:MAG: hypothetical protein H7832_11660 [Magnetococcus sp. DMHC-6]